MNSVAGSIQPPKDREVLLKNQRKVKMFSSPAQLCASTEHVSSKPFTPHGSLAPERGIAPFCRWPLRGHILGIRDPGISPMCLTWYLYKMGLAGLQRGGHMRPSAVYTPTLPGPLFTKKRWQDLFTGGLWTTGAKTHQAPCTVSGRVVQSCCFFNFQKIKRFIHSLTQTFVE